MNHPISSEDMCHSNSCPFLHYIKSRQFKKGVLIRVSNYSNEIKIFFDHNRELKGIFSESWKGRHLLKLASYNWVLESFPINSEKHTLYLLFLLGFFKVRGSVVVLFCFLFFWFVFCFVVVLFCFVLFLTSFLFTVLHFSSFVSSYFRYFINNSVTFNGVVNVHVIVCSYVYETAVIFLMIHSRSRLSF